MFGFLSPDHPDQHRYIESLRRMKAAYAFFVQVLPFYCQEPSARGNQELQMGNYPALSSSFLLLVFDELENGENLG